MHSEPLEQTSGDYKYNRVLYSHMLRNRKEKSNAFRGKTLVFCFRV